MKNYATLDTTDKFLELNNLLADKSDIVEQLLEQYYFPTEALDEAALLAGSFGKWDLVGKIVNCGVSESLVALLLADAQEKGVVLDI